MYEELYRNFSLVFEEFTYTRFSKDDLFLADSLDFTEEDVDLFDFEDDFREEDVFVDSFDVIEFLLTGSFGSTGEDADLEDDVVEEDVFIDSFDFTEEVVDSMDTEVDFIETESSSFKKLVTFSFSFETLSKLSITDFGKTQ